MSAVYVGSFLAILLLLGLWWLVVQVAIWWIERRKEDRNIRTRQCLCCGKPGHYQEMLEAHMAEHGVEGMGIVVDEGGYLGDGHHLIHQPITEVAAAVLAALRDAGFDIYRFDDGCDETTVQPELKDGTGYCWFGYVPAGTYRLVPVVPKGEG